MKLNFPGDRGNLYVSVCAANLASISIGTHYSWTSPALPKLEAPGSFIHLTSNEASWVGSLTALGTIFGPFLGGWVMDKLGRRWTLMLADVINLLAWAVLLTATSAWHIYMGRFLGGFSGGFVYIGIPVYVAEISEPQVRGPVGAIFAFLLVGGFLMEFLFGPYVSYSTLIYINFIPPVLFLLFFSLIPESPHYFIRKNKMSKALDSLTWLRKGRSLQEVQREFTELQFSLGVFFYCIYNGYNMSSYPWWPLASLVGYIISFGSGFGSLPYTVMGEVFPSNVKSIGSAISAGSSWFMAFLITLFFNNISESLGPHFAFFLLSIFCIISFLFTILFVPDTRGMTLQEILDLLNNQRGAKSKA
uniref:Major facilitator superfamily (MFS) profile domain-containing protein n=1 Tax=Homalodisca liturata TaxID=320908 RepID=A0A1B6JMD6_9HEMI